MELLMERRSSATAPCHCVYVCLCVCALMWQHMCMSLPSTRSKPSVVLGLKVDIKTAAIKVRDPRRLLQTAADFTLLRTHMHTTWSCLEASCCFYLLSHQPVRTEHTSMCAHTGPACLPAGPASPQGQKYNIEHRGTHIKPYFLFFLITNVFCLRFETVTEGEFDCHLRSSLI